MNVKLKGNYIKIFDLSGVLDKRFDIRINMVIIEGPTGNYNV